MLMKFLALNFSKLKVAMPFVLASLIAFPCNLTFAATSVTKVEYFDGGDPSNSGLGFIADGKTLYVGGCQVFDLASRTKPSGCRYPAHTRWANVSPDGTLILSTSIIPNGNKSMSFQIDAVTGKIFSSKPGLHFVPPIAIHPNNRFWAASRAGKTASASETIVVIDRRWKILKDNLYGETQRIFALEFNNEGSRLLVNGGGPVDGTTLQTATWKTEKGKLSTAIVPGILQLSPDNRLGVKVEGIKLAIVDISTGATITTVDLDVTDGEPQIAFSPDGRWFSAKGYRVIEDQRQYVFALLPLTEP